MDLVSPVFVASLSVNQAPLSSDQVIRRPGSSVVRRREAGEAGEAGEMSHSFMMHDEDNSKSLDKSPSGRRTVSFRSSSSLSHNLQWSQFQPHHWTDVRNCKPLAATVI